MLLPRGFLSKGLSGWHRISIDQYARMYVIRNEELRKALYQYTLDALQELEDLKKTQEIPQEISETWVRVDPRFLMKIYVTRGNFRLESDEIKSHLSRLPTFGLCKSIFLADSYTQKYNDTFVGTKFGGNSFSLYSLINNILREVLFIQEQITIELFDKLYSEFEEDLHSKTVSLEALIPIQGFEGDNFPIQIEENITLDKVSDPEKFNLLSLGFRFGKSYLTKGIEDENLGAIRIIEEDEKVFGSMDRSKLAGNKWEREKAPYLLFALHLLAKGRIDTLGQITQSKSLFIPGTGFHFEHGPPHMLGHRQYTFPGSKLQDFKEIWGLVKTIFARNDEYLQTILNRFRYAIQRLSAADRIVDLMTLLEGILLDERQGSSYMLAQRGAFLLAANETERIKIFDRLKSLYKVRSQIVHSGKVTGLSDDASSPSNIWNLADELEDYARKIILVKVKRYLKGEDINWDRVIFGNMTISE